MLAKILAKIRSEPALVAALVSIGLAAAATYGFKLSPDQIAAVWAATSLILGQTVRASVTPTSKTIVLSSSIEHTESPHLASIAQSLETIASPPQSLP